VIRHSAKTFLLVAVCATSALLAQEITNSKADQLKRPEVVRGQQVFAQNCAACHGTNATGGMGPNLLASALVRHDIKGDLIGKVVREGRMDKGMPAFPKLTDAQISDIASFVHARIDASARASALGASAFSGSLNVGDARAGKAYFDAKCVSCHSATGDLNGIAKKHDAAELEELMLMPKVPDTGSVTTAGTTVKGTFLHHDAFTVTLKDSDGMTHTWLMGAGVHVSFDDVLKGHRALLQTYTDKDIHDVFSYLETLR
jgi:cytochrome c oxidase cbb3-type subunit 3